MNLQDFIKEALVQIARGIEGAAAELKDSKAVVNPRNVQTLEVPHGDIYGFVDTETKFLKAVQKVEFDVAVSASTGSATKGGIGIMVGAIGLGSQGKSESRDSSVSRIKFQVPMVLPMENAPHDSEDPVAESA
jgi:hypothetical protein